MTPAGILIGVLIATGALLLITGAERRAPASAAPSRGPSRPRIHLTRTEQITIGGALAAGFLTALITGWVILIPLLPAAAFALPRLLGGYGDKDRIELLESLEKWTRALSSVLGAHGSMQAALASTLKGCPPMLQAPTERLVTRLRAGQPAEWAIREWVDEVDDVTGDLIGGTLLMSVGATDRKLRRILGDLTEQVAHQVRIRRQVEAERSGPIREARIVMVIGTVLLAGFIFGTEIGQFYLASALGQLLLAVVVALFGLCLWGLKRASKTTPPPRFMTTRTLEETIR